MESIKNAPCLNLDFTLIPSYAFQLLFCRYRQGEEEGGANVILTFDPDFTAVTLYRDFTKSKANPQPPGLVRPTQAGEFIEDPFPFQNRYARSVIFY